MFTGIVQGVGTVADIARHGGETRLTLSPRFSLTDYDNDFLMLFIIVGTLYVSELLHSL